MDTVTSGTHIASGLVPLAFLFSEVLISEIVFNPPSLW